MATSKPTRKLNEIEVTNDSNSLINVLITCEDEYPKMLYRMSVKETRKVKVPHGVTIVACSLWNGMESSEEGPKLVEYNGDQYTCVYNLCVKQLRENILQGRRGRDLKQDEEVLMSTTKGIVPFMAILYEGILDCALSVDVINGPYCKFFHVGVNPVVTYQNFVANHLGDYSAKLVFDKPYEN